MSTGLERPDRGGFVTVAKEFIVDSADVDAAVQDKLASAAASTSSASVSGAPSREDKKEVSKYVREDRKYNKRQKRRGETIGLQRKRDPQLCNYVALGSYSPGTTGRCCGGNTSQCKRPTDPKTFLEKRDPRVELGCPIYEHSGHCPSGLLCSFSSCYDAEAYLPLRRAESELEPIYPEFHTLHPKLLGVMRRRVYPFKLAQSDLPPDREKLLQMALQEEKLAASPKEESPQNDPTQKSEEPPEKRSRVDPSGAAEEPPSSGAGSSDDARAAGSGLDTANSAASYETPAAAAPPAASAADSAFLAGLSEQARRLVLAERRASSAPGRGRGRGRGGGRGRGRGRGRGGRFGKRGRMTEEERRAADLEVGRGLLRFSREGLARASDSLRDAAPTAQERRAARDRFRKAIRGQVYVAPLTTTGNLPFRRVMQDQGADVTCGEMALFQPLLEGQGAEWQLLRRHASERFWGPQLAVGHSDAMARVSELCQRECGPGRFSIEAMSELGLSALASRAAAQEAARMKQVAVDSAAALGSFAPAAVDGSALAGSSSSSSSSSSAATGSSGLANLPPVRAWQPSAGTRPSIGCDFIDINMGCPLDMVCLKGVGATLMKKYSRVRTLVQQHGRISSTPLTLKVRVGYEQNDRQAHSIAARSRRACAVAALTVHGRTRAQRYTKRADWSYIARVARQGSKPLTWLEVREERRAKLGTVDDVDHRSALEAEQEDEQAAEAEEDGEEVPELPVLGNGDVFQWQDHWRGMEESGCCTTMLARGALIKPWLPREIKTRAVIDVSAQDRFRMLQDFVRYGLEHWGSDPQGVRLTRRFLLEWLSFLYRYVPAGLLERGHTQGLNQRPPAYRGRDDLETLMASARPYDWVRISEMLLGPVPEGFSFTPKHKANAFATGSAALVSGAVLEGAAREAGMAGGSGAAQGGAPGALSASVADAVAAASSVAGKGQGLLSGT